MDDYKSTEVSVDPIDPKRSTRCRLDLTWTIQPDPQLTTCGNTVRVPCLLPLDQQLSIASTRIEELMRQLQREESADRTIARMEARIEATRKHIQQRLKQLSLHIEDMEREWISELHAKELQVFRSRYQQRRSKIKRDDESAQGMRMNGKEPKKKDSKAKFDLDFYGVCEITDNYKKSIASLSSAVAALDDVIRFPGALDNKTSHAEVTNIRDTLYNFLQKLRSQLEASAGAGTPRMVITPRSLPTTTTTATTGTKSSTSNTSTTPPTPLGNFVRASKSSSGSSIFTLPYASRSSSNTNDIFSTSTSTLSSTTTNSTSTTNTSSTTSSSTILTPDTVDTTQKSSSINSLQKTPTVKTATSTSSTCNNLAKPEKGGENIRLPVTPSKVLTNTSEKEPKNGGTPLEKPKTENKDGNSGTTGTSSQISL